MSGHTDKNIQNRDILAEIIDFSADAVVSVDGDHNIVWVNTSFEKIFGYQKDEILGQSLNILLPQSLHPVHSGYIEAYGNSAEKSRYMGDRDGLYGVSKTGDKIPLDISIQKHPEGSFCRYTALCRDISSRVAREKYIRESEAKFSKLFNSSHHFTVLMNGTGNVLEFNATAEQLLWGVSEKYIDRKIWDCDFWASEGDTSRIQAAILKLDPEKDDTFIVNAIDSNNRKITVEISLKIIWMDHKDAMRIILEGNDVTALIRSNKALIESEGRLARAQKIARLGNWEWRIATDEIICSDEAREIFGLAPEESRSNYNGFVEIIHPKDRERVEKAIIDALKGNSPYHISHRIILPDGTEKVVEQWAVIRRLEDGNAVQMDGIIQDITDRWNREQELLAAKRQAEKANIAKAEFLSTIGHELRTPLNAIIGFSTMIAEEYVGKINVPFYRDYAVDINTSGKQLLRLIQNILQVTNFELGSVIFKPSRLSARSLLDAVMSTIATRAAGKNIHIETHVSPDMPDLYLDQGHMQRILVHLVDNAIKFSKSSDSIEVNLFCRGSEFIIEVVDQGIGFEEKDGEIIFDPFVQKDMTLGKVYGGVGLGLTIVKNLVEIQGGRVQVESVPGQGSCFSVCFPNARADNIPVENVECIA